MNDGTSHRYGKCYTQASSIDTVRSAVSPFEKTAGDQAPTALGSTSMKQSTLPEYQSVGVPCPECNRTFSSEKGVNIHRASAHSEGSKKKTYTCAECGDTFEDYPSRREHRGRENFFCGRDCKDEYQSDDVIETECANCGDTLRLPEHRFENMGDYAIDHHFCDKECESEWKQENWVEEHHPSWDGEDVTVECEECGDPFEVRPSTANHPTRGRFCSWECTGRHQADATVELDCPVCGDTFETKSYNIKGEHTMCSSDCHREFMSSTRRGEQNPAWKGGKAHYYGPNWNQQRRAALERDGHTCQLCGMDSEEHRETYRCQLNIHHIVRFKAFDDHQSANELSNLVTVCHNCHKTLEQQDESTQRSMLTAAPLES